MSQSAKGSPAGASGPTVEERRAWVRYACDFPTSCQPIAAERTVGWAARVLNLSSGGLNLVANRRFESGTLLQIVIEHVRNPAPTTLLARVVHVRRKDKVLWSIGCAFARILTDEEVQALLESSPASK
jgi:hypothetical protein